MPIAFPLPLRGNTFDRWRWQKGAASPWQKSVNIARPGLNFFDDLLYPGIPLPKVRPRKLGVMYQKPGMGLARSFVNPASELQRPSSVRDSSSWRIYVRMLGGWRYLLSGVTRDSAGAPLGSCRVMVFRTADNLFIGETTSDAATGAWSFYTAANGPFFTVDYLAGAPDRAGTSVNTLAPTLV